MYLIFILLPAECTYWNGFLNFFFLCLTLTAVLLDKVYRIILNKYNNRTVITLRKKPPKKIVQREVLSAENTKNILWRSKRSTIVLRTLSNRNKLMTHCKARECKYVFVVGYDEGRGMERTYSYTILIFYL